MNTLFMLMAQYGVTPAIDLEVAAKDWLGIATRKEALRQLRAGELPFPVVPMGDSQKSPRKVMLGDLAEWIDEQHKRAVKEYQTLAS